MILLGPSGSRLDPFIDTACYSVAQAFILNSEVALIVLSRHASLLCFQSSRLKM